MAMTSDAMLKMSLGDGQVQVHSLVSAGLGSVGGVIRRLTQRGTCRPRRVQGDGARRRLRRRGVDLMMREILTELGRGLVLPGAVPLVVLQAQGRACRYSRSR